MRTFNIEYVSKLSLQKFCIENKIPNSSNVLVQVFTGILEEKKIKDLLHEIKEILPNINIIGSSTDGEINQDKIYCYSIVLSFSIFESTQVKVYSVERKKSSFQIAKSLVKMIENPIDAKVAITFADGLNTNGDGFLKAFQKISPNIIIAGGLAGDNATFTKTFVFSHDNFENCSAVCAVLYGKNLEVNTASNFGWEPIGKALTITKAFENRVYTIDNLPAVKIYEKYLGSEISKQLPATGIEFPLIIQRDNIQIARAVTGSYEDGSLVFAGNIKKGDTVYLGYGNIEHILNNRFSLYNILEKHSIESIFIYSCMARRRLMGEDIINEIIPLSSVVAVSGFFTYGEFYDFKGKKNLLNQTTTILTLSESENKIKIHDNKRFAGQDIQTVKALSHLISVTTKELNELNDNLQNKVQFEVEKNIQQEFRLLEQSKMASMGEMLANIAHQWRQPLSSISSLASGVKVDTMLGLPLSNDEIENKMDIILTKTDYLSNTINIFRNFLKEEKEFKAVNLQNRLETVFQIVGTSLKDNYIELEYKSYVKEPIFIEMVVGEIDQVIINIINNAKDVILEKKIENGQIDIVLSHYQDVAVITVEDNGGGVPKHVLPRIFEPYFTTKHQSQGTGLGLHMSYKIIKESLKGELYVENTISGAKFTVKIPLK